MGAIINWILGISADDEVIKTLKSSPIKSFRVIGRGTLVVDADEIRRSDKFKEDARKAAEIVRQIQRKG